MSSTTITGIVIGFFLLVLLIGVMLIMVWHYRETRRKKRNGLIVG